MAKALEVNDGTAKNQEPTAKSDGEPDRDVRVLQDHARIRLVMREGRIVVDRRPPPP